MSAPPFIHLRVHSTYSLLEGAIGIKELAKWCAKHKMPAVALADSGNLFGSLEFALSAAENGVQPIHALNLFFKPLHQERASAQVQPDQLLLIAQDEEGWKNLLHLASQAYLAPAAEPAPLLSYDGLTHHTGGIIALSGGIHGAIGKALLKGQHTEAEQMLERFAELFPNRFYIELSRHGLPEEKQTERAFIDLALKHNLPLVATNDCYFIDEDMYEAHDAFLCIAQGSYVGEGNRRRLTPEHRLKTPGEMHALFADIPEAIANTSLIARRCSYIAQSLKPILPRFAENEDALLREEARKGLEERMQGNVLEEYCERLEYELDVIIKMKFPGYFLIVSDFIKWAKAQGIPVGPGRGSGAGSLVAWSLLITDLDPLRYGLLFERFLNPERVSMPDFDIDFCQDRREEVIHYVQQRYGRERVAQIITFGKLQARAVLRDVGRVLQMPYGQVDRICKLVPNNPAAPVTLKEAIEVEPMLKAAIEEDESVAHLVDISLKLEGLNRHASTHAAGVVIGDRPLSELVPMYRDPKHDMPVVQYSMKYAEAAGLVKFDFLGLKTLTVLQMSINMLKARGIEIDLLRLPEGDRKTYELLARGDTVGVFQLESAGMRDTLKKLKADCLEDIIALVSLYRPGPMDNIPTYIARKHGLERPNYLHPKIESVLKETFGVIIYQEQVMQIAQLLAGYSLGEADLLRRAMGKKIRSEMEAQRDVFVKRAIENGVEQQDAKGIFDLISKFAEYGFNKSHAAAYAVIAYQTAFMKANYPQEFFAASMTYDMHNTDKLGVFKEDAAQARIKLLPPDINRSGVYFIPESGTENRESRNSVPDSQFSILDSIRYALAAIRNVGAQAMQAVVQEREKNGAFKDVFDFAARVEAQALNKRALEHLIKAGAFDSLHENRAQLVAAIDLLVAYGVQIQEEKTSNQVNLFAGFGEEKSLPRPVLPNVEDWPAVEKLAHEFEAIGFYLSAHPLEGYSSTLKALGVIPSVELAERLGEKYAPLKVAGIVTGRKFKVSDKGRFAFVQLSDMSGVVEVSVFNEQLLSQHRERLENGNMLVIHADGKADDGGVRIIAQEITTLNEERAKQQKRAGNARLRIVVNNPQIMPQLRTMLGETQPQGSSVTLEARLEQGAVEVALPGKYAVTPGVLDRLRVIQGVLSCDDA